MRVKIAINYPLDKYHCWFAIEKSLENQSIHQLAKQIVNKLELEAAPSNLKLLLEGYQLLPQTKIKEVLRDGDLITIKQNRPKNTDIVKKRKRSIEEDETHLKKKVKKEKEPKKTEKKPKDQKSKKTSEDQKSEKKLKDQKPEKVIKKKKESKRLQKQREDREKKTKTKDTEKKKKDNKNKKQVSEPMADIENQKTSKVQSAPFEGSLKTKKRNQRRKLLKQLYRQSGTEQYQEQAQNEEQYQDQAQNEEQYQDQAPSKEQHQEQMSSKEQYQTQAPVEQVLDEVQTLKITEPSATLLKKNKNKKKNHLKGPKADNRQHVHYEERVQDEPEQITSNHYGRAFITFAESDPYYKGNNMSPHKYPIHNVSTLFYAEKISAEKETEKEPREEPEQADIPVNYDNYPDVDFKSNVPSVGNQLAIKTLELTANYTPEISEWKQVILKELHLPSSITVEFMPGFYHVNTKGGKFDNKAHEKRNYDDWEHFEEEEEEEEEDKIVTLDIDNVFVVKNMST